MTNESSESGAPVANGELADGCPKCGSQRVRENTDRKPIACFECGWSA